MKKKAAIYDFKTQSWKLCNFMLLIIPHSNSKPWFSCLQPTTLGLLFQLHSTLPIPIAILFVGKGRQQALPRMDMDRYNYDGCFHLPMIYNLVFVPAPELLPLLRYSPCAPPHGLRLLSLSLMMAKSWVVHGMARRVQGHLQCNLRY